MFKSKLSVLIPSKSRFMFDYHCRVVCGVSQNLPCHGNVPSFPREIMSPKRIQISKNRWLDSLKIKKTACAILQLRDIFFLYFVLLCFLSFFVEHTHSKKLSINKSNTSFRLITFNTLVSFVSGGGCQMKQFVLTWFSLLVFVWTQIKKHSWDHGVVIKCVSVRGLQYILY